MRRWTTLTSCTAGVRWAARLAPALQAKLLWGLSLRGPSFCVA